MTTKTETLKSELQNLLHFKKEFKQKKFSNGIAYVKSISKLLKNTDIDSFVKSGTMINKTHDLMTHLIDETILDIDNRIEQIESLLKK